MLGLAGWTGLEPATSGVTGRHSNQLNYHPSEEGVREKKAGWTGLEPATSGVTGRHSNQLNYHPVSWAHLGLNQGPAACKAAALPLSYTPITGNFPAKRTREDTDGVTHRQH